MEWLKKLPKDAQFRRVPAVFNDEWALDAKVFYALEAIGEQERVHRALFDAIHRQGGVTTKGQTYIKWVAEFLAKQTAEGVDDVKRIEAVAAIADFGRSNGGLLPVLHKLLASPSVRFRSHVAVALEKIGAPDSGPALAAALRKETKDRAKAALLRALAVCDGVTPAHKKAIVAAAKAGGQIERTAALRAMADLDLGTEGEAVVMAALKDGSGPVRATAYFAAAKQNVKGALQIVEKQAAGEKASEIRQVAEAALAGLRDGAFDSATAGGLLKPYLSDEDLR